jgi:putative transposase
MKQSKFTDSQIFKILEEHKAGISVPDICRQHGISSATYYKWRAKYGGLDISMISRVKELEVENQRLKKMYAESKMDAEILREALAKKW